jgi:hypothetical protein
VLKVIAILFAAFATCTAADIAANWSGTLSLDNGNMPAYLVLKQTGNELCGTAGPTPDKQIPIDKGRVDGQNVTIEAKPGAATLRFTLTIGQDGHTLAGDVYESDRKIGTASFSKVGK